MVGAGVGGLAAAYALVRLSAERGRSVDLAVLDSDIRPGGVVGTELHEGTRLERGADTLVTHKPAALELCRRLGLERELVFPPPGRSDILHRGRLRPVPDGFALLAPTRPVALLSSPLLGWHGKLRVLAEPWVAAAPAASDESVASFVRRRYGGELLERLVEPIVGAIYMADVERLSLAATFPRFRALERERGSISRGLAAARHAPGGAATPRAAAPAVAALAGGLGRLVDALVGELPAGALRLGRGVEALGAERAGWSLRLAGGERLGADAVLLATPAPVARSLLSSAAPELATELGGLACASCATVHLAWRREALRRPPRSHGFFVPRAAAGDLVAATFVDVKFPERVPSGLAVVRAFAGGALRPAALERSDQALAAAIADELASPLGAREAPLWIVVRRHPESMPRLAVGHLERVERIRRRAAEHPGLGLAGGPLGAYGLPDVIAAGEAAAERLLERVPAGPAERG